jgi:hypothetical protein
MKPKQRIRTVGSVSSELLKKSREAALAAVQVFNNPAITFKSEIFVVMTAWLCACHPSSLRANFQGGNGQLALERAAVLELRRLTSQWPSRPFAGAVGVKSNPDI